MRANRLNQLSMNIFSELAAEKRRVEQQGMSTIDLSVGSPDLPPHRTIMETLAEYAKSESSYGYTLSAIPSFYSAVAHFYQKRYAVQLDPGSEILQVVGSQEGLFLLSLSLINPGDYVLLPDPSYPIYETSSLIAGANIHRLPLLEENNFLPQLRDIPENILKRAKLLFLNYPGNPIPAIAPRQFFEEVVAFAKEHGIFVVHDFAYSELVYDGNQVSSFLSVPGAKEVGVEFNSLSKTFHMAGCRIGYVAGNPQMIKAVTLLMSQVHYGIFYPIQKAAEKALTSDLSFLKEQVKTYQARRDLVVEGLSRAGWAVNKPPATMYIWTKTPNQMPSRQFCYQLLHNTGVVLTPGDAFGKNGEGYVRINLVQPEERLAEAVERIGNYLKKAF